MSMFYALLALATDSLRGPMSPGADPSFFLCDHLIEGSVCDSKGMALYVSFGYPPPRPSVFYPISHTVWSFTESFIKNTLGVTSSDQENVSGKYSGVFYPSSTGSYTFALTVSHALNNKVCHFSLFSVPSMIEIDLSLATGGQDFGMYCGTNPYDGCSDYYTNIYWWYCYRQYYLVAGQPYPLFAGTRYNVGIPYSDMLRLYFEYTDPSGNVYKLTSSDCVTGYAGYTLTATPNPTKSASRSQSPSPTRSVTASRSPSPSMTTTFSAIVSHSYQQNSDSGVDDSSSTASSKKSSTFVIGGASVGVVVIVVIAAVGVWLFISRNKGDRVDQGGRPAKSTGGLRMGMDSRQSGKSSRKRSGSGSSSRKRSGSGSSSRRRGGSCSSSRRRGGTSSRQTSGTSSRHMGGRSGQQVSGTVSRRGSASTPRK